MARYQIEASLHIHAPGKQVYDIISDYRNGHPNILPKKYFKELKVEKGGVGAGTEISFSMTVGGRTTHVRASITEPAPGRVLVETVLDSDIVTTFTVEPFADGHGCDVTISTELNSHDGIFGIIERFVTKRMLLRIYTEELQQLAEFAAKKT